VGNYYSRIITLQTRGTADDGYGGTVPVWEDLRNAFARVRQLRGKELVTASAEKSLTRTIFYIAYRADVNETMRIAYGGKNYEIVEPPVDVDDRHLELEIHTRAVGAA